MIENDSILSADHLSKFGLSSLLSDKFLKLMFKLSPNINHNDITTRGPFNGFVISSNKKAQLDYLRTFRPYTDYENELLGALNPGKLDSENNDIQRIRGIKTESTQQEFSNGSSGGHSVRSAPSPGI